MEINKEELARIMAAAAMQQADPRAHRQEAARQATRDHMLNRLPSPKAGGKIRCVFSTMQPAFKEDELVFVEGRVYDVELTGIAAMEEARATSTATDEQFNELLVRMADHFVEFPEAEGTTCIVSDPQTGHRVNVTFPAHPSATFVMVPDDAVDEPMFKDLPEGTTFNFSELTIIGKKATNLKTGVTYTVGAGRAACHCDDPACPGKNVIIYPVNDGNGEVVLTLPFNVYGVATIHKH